MLGGARRLTRACVLFVAGVILLPVAGTAHGNDLRLIEAARNRDARAVSGLLKQVDVNIAQPDGTTALLWAAQWDDVEMADALLRAGANVNAANDYGVTPLWFAATNGSAAMTHALLKAKADPAAALPSGETVLMTAARTGNVPVVKALLAAGANVQAQERLMGQTALIWALSEGHLDVARILLERGAGVGAHSATGFTPLLFAARQGDLAAVKLLMAHGANIDETAADGTSVLHMATVRGHVELAEFLLDQGADPNANGPGYTALHWAAGTWETATTRDYGIREWRALVGVPREGKTRLLKALLAHGANPNARTTKNVPRFGSSVWKIHGGGSPAGATPLFFAATVADLDVMRLLLAHGADPLLPTNDNTTPLLAAAGLGVEESEHGVPERNHFETVKMLIDLGADVHVVNAQGNTALHAAAFLGYDSLARFFLDRGVALNTKNKAGQTPYKIASGIMVTSMFFQHPSTAELLKSVGGIE